jgi:hypothetical protein
MGGVRRDRRRPLAGWTAYLADLRDEGEPLEVVVLCLDRAEREFG